VGHIFDGVNIPQGKGKTNTTTLNIRGFLFTDVSNPNKKKRGVREMKKKGWKNEKVGIMIFLAGL